MGTLKLAVRPIPHAHAEVEHSRTEPSAQALLKTEPGSESFRFSAILAGLILTILLALVAEVAVCALVNAAFNLVSKVCHEARSYGYHADEAIATSDDIGKASASSVSSSSAERQTSPSTHRQIATHK